MSSPGSCPRAATSRRSCGWRQQVLDSGVTALYADIEPFDGFCNLDCAYLAENFWWPLSASRPNANLGVIYDPRPWFWEHRRLDRWLATANVALPMCYWELMWTRVSRRPGGMRYEGARRT